MHRDAAAQFAACLDREDYAAARDFLAPDCAYLAGGRTIRGAAAVLADYQANGDWGRSVLDRIVYTSRVVESDAEQAVVEFSDEIERGGRRHVHLSRQRLWFDGGGRITRNENIDEPAAALLAAFFVAVGVERPE